MDMYMDMDIGTDIDMDMDMDMDIDSWRQLARTFPPGVCWFAPMPVRCALGTHPRPAGLHSAPAPLSRTARTVRFAHSARSQRSQRGPNRKRRHTRTPWLRIYAGRLRTLPFPAPRFPRAASRAPPQKPPHHHVPPAPRQCQKSGANKPIIGACVHFAALLSVRASLSSIVRGPQ